MSTINLDALQARLVDLLAQAQAAERHAAEQRGRAEGYEQAIRDLLAQLRPQPAQPPAEAQE